jgi:hypothetical protein
MALLQGLRNLGIEKGKPFNPTPYQQEILEEAAYSSVRPGRWATAS